MTWKSALVHELLHHSFVVGASACQHISCHAMMVDYEQLCWQLTLQAWGLSPGVHGCILTHLARWHHATGCQRGGYPWRPLLLQGYHHR